MKKFSVVDKLRYRFDNTMSRGTTALVGWLGLASAVFIVLIASVVALARIHDEGMEPPGLIQAIWTTLTQTLGASGGGVGWKFRLSNLVVKLGSIFVLSTFIGVLTSGIRTKLEDLRRGRSPVVEKDHTVILGWSPLVFSILSELIVANANRRHSCIAILSDTDKVQMEDKIRLQVGNTGRTRIVCRSGSPVNLAELEIVNPHAARSIVIIPPETDDPDSQVIKTILALIKNENRRAVPYHIVAAIRDRKNLQVAKMVGGDEVELLLVGDSLSRIVAQTCHQTGLSIVYTELLNFTGNEVYLKEEPGLVGKSFGEALLAYEDSALIGLRMKDGRTELNPPMDTRIAVGDRVIAVSEDDDTVRLSGLADYSIDESAIREKRSLGKTPERTLILGWNLRVPTIINELDTYMAPGSKVKVVAAMPEGEAAVAAQFASLRNQALSLQRGDTTDRGTLDSLAIESYQHVIVASYSDTLARQEADARTLVTLLHLRDMADRTGHSFSIVSEMLDTHNRELAEVARVDDFVVGDNLVSLILSQLAESKEVGAVLADLFQAEGSELYLKPISDYVQMGKPVNFYTVVEAARRRQEVAIGYQIKPPANSTDETHGMVINPNKSEKVTFTENDRVIVLARD